MAQIAAAQADLMGKVLKAMKAYKKAKKTATGSSSPPAAGAHELSAVSPTAGFGYKYRRYDGTAQNDPTHPLWKNDQVQTDGWDAILLEGCKAFRSVLTPCVTEGCYHAVTTNTRVSTNGFFRSSKFGHTNESLTIACRDSCATGSNPSALTTYASAHSPGCKKDPI